MIQLPPYVLMAMGIKEHFYEMLESGDVPPYIMVERQGRIDYMIHTAANLVYDAMPHLRAVHYMMDYDALIVVHEIRMKVNILADGTTYEEADRRHRETYQQGDFERLTRAGKAGEHGIVDAVMAHRAAPGQKQVGYILPYLYSGKGTPFSWLRSMFLAHGVEEDSFMGGDVPAAIDDALCSRTMAEHMGDAVIATLVPKEIVNLDTNRKQQVQTWTCLDYLSQRPGVSIMTASHAWGSLMP